jgi:hypothetical protein
MRTLKCWTCCFALSLLGISAAAAQQKNPAPNGTAHLKTTAIPLAPAANRAAEENTGTKLPVRHVVLYKTGVGYFEHSGHVRGNQSVRVDFTSGQLNDVLQSLTILDLSGGRIARVNYNSEAPLSQRLGALHLPLEEKTDLAKFYGALRGARLQMRSGTMAMTGRLLSVERKTRLSGGTTLEVDLATVVSDSGEVRSVELTPTVSVQLAEGDVTQKVSRYLHLLASVRQEGLRRMTIDTAGAGERQLYISYISEVPIWKTTYRVVLPSKANQGTLLQGWAIVDNTVGEDWNDVELSLVAGAPQSFIEQLSQPYYARRPVVPLPESAQLAPQTHEGAMLGGIAGLSGRVLDSTGGVIKNAKVTLLSDSGVQISSTTTDNEGGYSFVDLPSANYRLKVEFTGFRPTIVQGLSLGGGRARMQDVTLQVGSVTSAVEVASSSTTVDNSSIEVATAGAAGSGGELGSGRGVGVGGGLARGVMGGVATGSGGGSFSVAAISDARREMAAAAQGSDLGDFFQYKLKDRVTIHKNESALVPIVQTQVVAEKVSLWSASFNSSRPLRALWLTNSSPLTLDGGSFSVLEDETFAGEGLTDSIKSGEKRLVSFATDLGVRVHRKTRSDPQRVTRVRIDRGVMRQVSELREDTSYTVRNDDPAPRTILIEHPLRGEWKLAAEGEKPEETTSDAYRFRVNLEGKATAILGVREAKPLEARYELTNLDEHQVTLFLQQKSINTEVEAAFRKIIEQKSRVAALEAEISRREAETQKIYDDQQRLRENLKALKGSSEERALTQRYTQQLADQETRLETLRRESADVEAKRDQEQSKLDKMIEDLTLDVDL